MFTHNSSIRRTAAVWFGSHPVSRTVYATHGVVLAGLKYLGDVALIYAATGMLWTPVSYVRAMPSLLPSHSLYLPPWLAWAVVIWMVPFMAVGVMLSARRAMDAGRSPWLSILFLVPYANYLVILLLASLPSRPRRQHSRSPAGMSDFAARVVSCAVGVGVAVVAVAVGVATLQSYGAWLFLVTPFAAGAGTAFLYNRFRSATANQTASLVLLTTLMAGIAILLVAIEGALCLIMSAPLSALLAQLGGMVGRLAAHSATNSTSAAMFMVLALPLTAAIEPASGRALREVRSSVVVDAPPGEVWDHVVAFRQIPEPTDWLFRAGVAYPVRAHIDGFGVGAVRYCVFSTGSFVEPITRWEPGRRLSFDVAESPAPLKERSFYRNVSPPHLHGYLRPQRGEFRLVDLGDGRTRLEGSTWYEIEMAPETYWAIFSDALIHRIHQRVLDHITQEATARSPRRTGH